MNVKIIVNALSDYRINMKQNDKSTVTEHFSVAYYSLCRYRKRIDIYYSTSSFENVSKNCQFQF